MYNILHLAWMNGFGNSTKSCQLKSIPVGCFQKNCKYSKSENPLSISKLLLTLVIRRSLKSRPETWDLGPWNLRPRTPGLWDSGPWDPETWDSGTLQHGTKDPGTRSLGLGNCNPETQNPESKTLRIELVTQIPSIPTRTNDWINFNCEASFDNKKLGYVSQKLRCSSRWTKNFAKILWHLT